MNKLKLLSIISIGLLITNVMLVAFILTRHAEKPTRQEPRNIVIDKLHFTDNQIHMYDSLIKGHRASIKQWQDDVMKLKNQLYSSLAEENKAEFRDSIIIEISKVQMKIEQIHYSHFEDIKRLCKGDQLNLFNQLTQEIAAIFAPQRPKGMN